MPSIEALGDWVNFRPNLIPRKSFQDKLQIAWDSTSLGALKRCAREYYYSIVCQVIPSAESVHLTFGILYHAAIEKYHHAVATGVDHEEALRAAVRFALEKTWDPDREKPWMSDHPEKNRLMLIFTIIDYLDFYTPHTDRLKTVIFPKDSNLIYLRGKPAVELSFRFDTSLKAPDGTPIKLCGHIDRLATMDSMTFAVDYKTTTKPLNKLYWAQFSPSNQMSLYDIAGQIVFAQKINGVIIDAVKIATDSREFKRSHAFRTDYQRDEWMKDFTYYYALAESYADAKYWPMNDTACVRGFGLCPYYSLWSNCPSTRGLGTHGAEWIYRHWDPLEARSAG